MLIECTIRRKNGTHLEYPGGVIYHFKPAAPGGPHVCAVAPEHVQSFLNVPEAYRLAEKPKAEKEPEGADAPNAPHVLQGDGGAGAAGEGEASPATPRKRGRKPKAQAVESTE